MRSLGQGRLDLRPDGDARQDADRPGSVAGVLDAVLRHLDLRRLGGQRRDRHHGVPRQHARPHLRHDPLRRARFPATSSRRPTTSCRAAPSTTTSTSSPSSGSSARSAGTWTASQFASRDNWFSTGGPFPAPFDVDFHLLLEPGRRRQPARPARRHDGVPAGVRHRLRARLPGAQRSAGGRRSRARPPDDVITPGDDLTITVSATDDGSIQKVEFLAGQRRSRRGRHRRRTS